MAKKQDGRIDEKQIDDWLKKGHQPEDVKTLLQEITKAVLERALQGEMTEHLGYAKNDVAEKNTDNARNGSSAKSLKGEFGEIELETPRDRKGEFEPRLIKKHQTRFTGFDEKVLSLYARGMTTREIQGHLEEMYGVEVSPALISDITDGVMEQAKAWQSRPLDAFYPVIFLDALFVKMRHEGRVENRAVFVALGINLEGQKEVLGLWTGAGEGARFWLGVLTELRNRGVKDIYVACVDGLRGFPQAIENVFPKAQVQLCIVHLIRNSLNYVTWKDLRNAATDLKPIYRAATAEQAEQELEEFEKKWTKYPAIGKLWREHWQQVIPFFAMPVELRKVVYTTNAVESLHRSLRKAIKTRGAFPREEAAIKLIYLTITKVAGQWHTVQNWKPALNIWRRRAAKECARPSALDSLNRSEPTSRMGAHPACAARQWGLATCQNGARSQGFASPRGTRALAPCAPFWHDGFATGGSGGMSFEAISTTDQTPSKLHRERLHKIAHTPEERMGAR